MIQLLKHRPIIMLRYQPVFHWTILSILCHRKPTGCGFASKIQQPNSGRYAKFIHSPHKMLPEPLYGLIGFTLMVRFRHHKNKPACYKSSSSSSLFCKDMNPKRRQFKLAPFDDFAEIVSLSAKNAARFPYGTTAAAETVPNAQPAYQK